MAAALAARPALRPARLPPETVLPAAEPRVCPGRRPHSSVLQAWRRAAPWVAAWVQLPEVRRRVDWGAVFCRELHRPTRLDKPRAPRPAFLRRPAGTRSNPCAGGNVHGRPRGDG